MDHVDVDLHEWMEATDVPVVVKSASGQLLWAMHEYIRLILQNELSLKQHISAKNVATFKYVACKKTASLAHSSAALPYALANRWHCKNAGRYNFKTYRYL